MEVNLKITFSIRYTLLIISSDHKPYFMKKQGCLDFIHVLNTSYFALICQVMSIFGLFDGIFRVKQQYQSLYQNHI